MDPVTGQPAPTEVIPAPAAAAPAVTPPPAAPVVSDETLAQITKRVTDSVTAGLTNTLQQTTQNALEAQRQQIVRAIGGNQPTEKDRDAAFLDKFATQPLDTIAAVAFQSKEAAKREIREEDAQRDARRREQFDAAGEVFADRPDIKSNPESREMLDALYERTDPNLPEKERMQQALHKHDKWMESQGLGTKEERVAKVASPKHSASAGGTKPEPQQKTSEQFQQEEQRERVEAYKRKHGGRYVAAA